MSTSRAHFRWTRRKAAPHPLLTAALQAQQPATERAEFTRELCPRRPEPSGRTGDGGNDPPDAVRERPASLGVCQPWDTCVPVPALTRRGDAVSDGTPGAAGEARVGAGVGPTTHWERQ